MHACRCKFIGIRRFSPRTTPFMAGLHPEIEAKNERGVLLFFVVCAKGNRIIWLFSTRPRVDAAASVSALLRSHVPE